MHCLEIKSLKSSGSACSIPSEVVRNDLVIKFFWNLGIPVLLYIYIITFFINNLLLCGKRSPGEISFEFGMVCD